MFADAVDAPVGTERVWIHGDMHARNVIVNRGRLAGVIDWGDLCVGDRATDLAGAYMLVPDHIELVAARAGADAAAWRRARGWAVPFAGLYLTMAADDPTQLDMGRRLFASLGIDVN